MRIYIFILIHAIVQFLVLTNFTSFTNSVDPTGDSIEYQTFAVNFIHGHGFMKWGGIVTLDKYKFTNLESALSKKHLRTFRSYNDQQFIVGPIYPMFLALVYKFLGVNPLLVKYIQLFLICLASSLLIKIGFQIQGYTGLLIGVVSAWFYASSTFQQAGTIMTEPLLAFICGILILAWLNYKKKNSKKRAFILGLILAIGFLAKGIFYFVALFFFFFELYQFIVTRKLSIIKRGLRVVSFCFLFILPYLIWQNISKDIEELSVAFKHIDQGTIIEYLIRQPEFTKEEVYRIKEEENLDSKLKMKFAFLIRIEPSKVFICRHSDYLLLTSNNDYAKDGEWHDEALEDPLSFHNTLDEEMSSWMKVCKFYSAHPDYIIPAFSNKIRISFLNEYFPRIAMFLSILLGFGYFIRFKSKKLKQVYYLLSMIFIISLLFQYPVYLYGTIETSPVLLFSVVLLSLISMNIAILKIYPQLRLLAPFFWASLAISLLFYGSFRIITPLHLVLSYYAVFFIAMLAKECISPNFYKKTL